MNFNDVEHYATMLAGCESINTGNYKAEDAVYATTVLKMHANDAGLFAGQEGFLDAIKSGAKKTKDWIAALIKSITDWLSNKYRDAKVNINLKLKGGDDGIKRIVLRKIFKDVVSNGLRDINELDTDRYASLFAATNAGVQNFDKIKNLLKSLGDNLDGDSKFNTESVMTDLSKVATEIREVLDNLVDATKNALRKIPDESAVNYKTLDSQARDLGFASRIAARAYERFMKGVERIPAAVNAEMGVAKEKEVPEAKAE